MAEQPSAGGEGGAGSIDEAHHELWKVSPEVNATHLALTIVPVFILLLCAMQLLGSRLIDAAACSPPCEPRCCDTAEMPQFIKERLYCPSLIVKRSLI